MENITITFSNGKTKEYEKNTDFYTISLDYPMENKIIAAKVNNEIFPLDTKATKSETVEFIDVTSLAGYKGAGRKQLHTALGYEQNDFQRQHKREICVLCKG